MKLCNVCGALAPDNLYVCPLCGSSLHDEIYVNIPMTPNNLGGAAEIRKEKEVGENESNIEDLDRRLYDLEKKIDIIEEKVYEVEEIVWRLLIGLINYFDLWNDLKELYLSEGRKKDVEFIEKIKKDIIA